MKEKEELLTKWVEIGNQNWWIRESVDPTFTKKSIHFCGSDKDLEKHLADGNWCLGQGFAIDNICFINQVNGGDEWLTIKDDYSFESMTMERIIKAGEFKSLLARIRIATKEQCKNLDY